MRRTAPGIVKSMQPSMHCTLISPGAACSTSPLPASRMMRTISSCCDFKIAVVLLCRKRSPSGNTLTSCPESACACAMVEPLLKTPTVAAAGFGA
jgi:hypothetical protein